MGIAISVIIPVYNQEKYVGKCIRSVLCQSFQDFEIIIVNDGSTDESLKICRRYANKDSRISIIDKKNAGVSQARKDGVLKACGKYVCFLDSDDYLASNALEVLYLIVKEKQVDVAIGCFDIVFDNWGLIKKPPVCFTYSNKEIPRNQIVELITGCNGDLENQWRCFLTGRLCRRSCILNAMEKDADSLFPSTNEIEDVAFNFFLAPYIQSIWITSSVVYHYRYGGITSHDFAGMNGVKCLDDKYDYCVQHGCESVLPDVFDYYSRLLLEDVRCQFHYKRISEPDIRNFIHQEFGMRKLILWARDHQSGIPEKLKSEQRVISILDGDIDAFIQAVKEREKYLKKHHHWKMKILGYYQSVIDRVGLLSGI